MWYILNQERVKLSIINKNYHEENYQVQKILLFSPLWEKDVFFTHFILMIKIFIIIGIFIRVIWGVYFVLAYKELSRVICICTCVCVYYRAL